MTTPDLRVLVVRNDKLGDFMLSWPALKTLKQAQADIHVTVLVPEYTASIAHCCPWVDDVIIDPGHGASRAERRHLLNRMHDKQFDAMLTLFSTPRIGWLGWRAGIPMRMAPATKWAQIFYNHRVVQHRSQSLKPEYEYNVDLALALLERLNVQGDAARPPFWPMTERSHRQGRVALAKACGLSLDRPWWCVHAGSGGSAVNLTPERYAELIKKVHARLDRPVHWLFSAGPGEEAVATSLCDRLTAGGIDARRLPANQRLSALAKMLDATDGLIAGSTGPLHIAGCLDIATVGFYPAKRSATSLRWQTCNHDDRRLAFSPPQGDDTATDMSLIDLDAASAAIADLIMRRGAYTDVHDVHEDIDD
ncbi:glycosyltransferase family 9 protein [Zymobacter palmae]|nr:glycosyltransferase family 9 protein [Zymobacter palmae]